MVSCLVDFAFHNFLSAEFKPGRLSVSQELSRKSSVDISAVIFILVGRVFKDVVHASRFVFCVYRTFVWLDIFPTT